MATEILEQATEERLIRRRASAEEFWSLPESVLPTEYIDGEIIMAPAPNISHQRTVLRLGTLLQQFVGQYELGEMNISPLDVVLPSGDVVQPDLFLLDAKQVERADAVHRVNGAPPFLIEILSPGSVKHDMMTKRSLYERNGVREYWIVDVKERTVAQLILRKKHYVLTELGEADVIKSAVLSGFEMKVGDLLGG